MIDEDIRKGFLDMVNKNTMRCTREWSWIFCQDMPQAYGRKISNILTHPNAEPFFYFADKVEKAFEYDCKKARCNCEQHTWSSRRYGMIYRKDFNPYVSFGKEWTPPPLKEYYFKDINSDKPILVINNKYNEEWLKPPSNYLSLEFINKFIDTFKDKYKIYYIRYDNNSSSDGYFDDAKGYDFFDYKHPTLLKNVVTIYDYMNKHNVGYNEAQLEMMAQAKHIATVNGGNAVLSSYFGEDVIIYSSHKVLPERGIWGTGSWLGLLSGSNIIGCSNEKEMLGKCKERWL